MNGTHTLNSLRRWSCQDHQLPPVDQVKYIHVYDFDNTLFLSPLPNKTLWNTSTFGQLQAQDFLFKGGWWHNPNILANVGQGLAVEESRAWDGYWNEKIVELVQLSSQDPNAVTVLLTGRKEDGFSDLVSRMVASKGLIFDLVVLKPVVGPLGETWGSTMAFKQAFLRSLMLTYSAAEEIKIYEDRVKHVKGFRDFLADFNTSLMYDSTAQRLPITAGVQQVADMDVSMDPVTEVAEVQRMINVHNTAILNGQAPIGSRPYKIKRSVFYTGYLLKNADTEKLRSLVQLPANCPDHEVKSLANNILITPRPAPKSIMDKVGGMGAKMWWKVTGLGVFENRVWAARVAPVERGKVYYTENHTPCVVLATRRQSKPIEATRIANWQPVPEDKAFQFETTVGEKVLLRVEQEMEGEDDYEASFPNARNARKHPREEDFPPLGSQRSAGDKGPRPQQRNFSNNAYQNNHSRGGIGFASQRGGSGGANHTGGHGGRRGGGGNQSGFRGNNRGNRGGGGGRGRGRGSYRSLDDSTGQGYSGGSMSMQY